MDSEAHVCFLAGIFFPRQVGFLKGETPKENPSPDGFTLDNNIPCIKLSSALHLFWLFQGSVPASALGAWLSLASLLNICKIQNVSPMCGLIVG